MLHLLVIVISILWNTTVWAHANHGEEESFGHETHVHAEDAQEAGIVLATADSGSVERHLQVYGRLITPPTHQAQVRARFAGLVVKLNATTGDAVKEGQVLAIVESNESLRRYEVKAPISGVVQERLINQGEISTDAPLYTLLNQQKLWAELNIFPMQRSEVKVGQSVHVRHNGHDHDSTIISITPAPNNSGTTLPYVIARVPLNNDHQDMAAGDKVLADIDAQTIHAKVRVRNSAIQEIEGQTVVFVHHDEHYEAVPVELGVQDDHHSEVLKGLSVGDEYVAENSYLIKADLGKGAAEHEH